MITTSNIRGIIALLAPKELEEIRNQTHEYVVIEAMFTNSGAAAWSTLYSDFPIDIYEQTETGHVVVLETSDYLFEEYPVSRSNWMNKKKAVPRK